MKSQCSLCVINNPDLAYPLCDFDTNNISLGSRRILINLPNMPHYSLGPLPGSECDTLGTTLQQIAHAPVIKIYPNPAADILMIESAIEKGFNYFIQNPEGKIMLQGTFIQNETISLKDLPPGIYMVHITDENGNFILLEKVIKQ